MAAIQESFFEHTHPARYGDSPTRRLNLFLPTQLDREAKAIATKNENFQRAYSIIVKWADLELDGTLEKKKETALEGEFIQDVFGNALGYASYSTNSNEWNIEPKFAINGGEADVVIGFFTGKEKKAVAVIELKGPTVNVDRNKFNGRTPVRQCWDYLNDLPESTWGIVCNFVSFRLYHRSRGTKYYEHFALQDLRKPEIFRQFFFLFEKRGLLLERGTPARAEELLEQTRTQQKQVGESFYKIYKATRADLVRFLVEQRKMSLSKSIIAAQRLLDRVVFIAVCQSRGLFEDRNTIHTAYAVEPPFTHVTNPKWQNFIDLFRTVDSGNRRRNITGFNGGLFAQEKEIDDLNLDDYWTDPFHDIGGYDFRDVINVDLLGELFQRSVGDLKRLQLGSITDDSLSAPTEPKLKKAVERKRGGVYYTPPDFTEYICRYVLDKKVENCLTEIRNKNKIGKDELPTNANDKRFVTYFQESWDALKQIKIVDPACGSGAFLIKAYEVLEEHYRDLLLEWSTFESQKEDLYELIPDTILSNNLYGVDLTAQAVEITQLSLWLRTARLNKKLSDLSHNIIQGNSLVSDGEVDPRAFDWEKKFPEVFKREQKGFDCVIGNPPWERIKIEEREFFDGVLRKDIIEESNSAKRKELIERLAKTAPLIYEQFHATLKEAQITSEFLRNSGNYPLTGKGDINTYAVFAELAKKIVSPHGLVGLLVPSGIATDFTTKEYFASLIDLQILHGLFDFKNEELVFPDVDNSFRFSILLFGGTEQKVQSADFFFYAFQIKDLKEKHRQITLTASDFKLLNPNTLTCPMFRTKRDAELTKNIYRKVPILIDYSRLKNGNPWGINYLRMFDQMADSEKFRTAEQWKAEKFKRVGAHWAKGKERALPLYEAKMIQMYDHRAAGIETVKENYKRQGQTVETSLSNHQNPEFHTEPRWWVNQQEVENILSNLEVKPTTFLAFKNITSTRNTRSVISAFIPVVGVIHSAPLILFGEKISARLQSCFLANFNSFCLDYLARQKIGNVNLSYFLIEQFAMFPPDKYANRCPWDKRQTLEHWISERVLKLSCTANDLIPLAEAAGFEERVHHWDAEERAELMAQLDAAYFLLYEIKKEDVEYIMSTFSGTSEKGESFLAPQSTTARILNHYELLKSHVEL